MRAQICEFLLVFDFQYPQCLTSSMLFVCPPRRLFITFAPRRSASLLEQTIGASPHAPIELAPPPVRAGLCRAPPARLRLRVHTPLPDRPPGICPARARCAEHRSSLSNHRTLVMSRRPSSRGMSAFGHSNIMKRPLWMEKFDDRVTPNG